jgi:hypothetical protein
MPPPWLAVPAAISIVLALLSAALIVADILRGHVQHMAIMNVVWPLTTLYFGPFGLWAYAAFGRRHLTGIPSSHEKPFWQSVFTGASHCGAGCALGDFIGAWIVFGAGLILLGSMPFAHYVIEFVLAYGFGIVFQYFSIAPMRGLGFREGMIEAIKADTLSLIAFEVGMFAWMAVSELLLPGLEPTRLSYWFMMQIAMMLGFATTYPMNWRLIRRDIKEAM